MLNELKPCFLCEKEIDMLRRTSHFLTTEIDAYELRKGLKDGRVHSYVELANKLWGDPEFFGTLFDEMDCWLRENSPWRESIAPEEDPHHGSLKRNGLDVLRQVNA